MHFSRYSAFAVHMLLSLLIFSTLVFTMYFFWFPGDLFFLDGGYQGLKIVAVVDLVLGPLLTLVVFKPGKKSLRFDMATIATIQIAALGYGFYTTYHQQTLAVVYAEQTFNTLSRVAHVEANEQLVERELEPKSAKDFGAPYPHTIYTVQPSGNSMGKFIADLLNGFPEAHERSDKYLNLADNYAQMREDRLGRETLEDEGSWLTVEAALNKHNHSMDRYDLYRFKSRYAQGVAVFDPESMRIVDYIEIEEVVVADNDLPTSASADTTTTEETQPSAHASADEN